MPLFSNTYRLKGNIITKLLFPFPGEVNSELLKPSIQYFQYLVYVISADLDEEVAQHCFKSQLKIRESKDGL